MINRYSFITVLAALALGAPLAVEAQAAISEDFTGASTTNSWYFFNGACLTAGSATGVEPSGGSAGRMPGCTSIKSSYYNENLVGGYNGTFPDPVGSGALRFTNGRPGGYQQNGAIVSTTPFPTGQGISVTFKTVTYLGDSGGAGGDGADGISFYLMDASQLNTSTITGTSSGDGNGIGAWGGSLGYTCSNANPPYNGLVGAYLGLGIDEFGNFLNGATWMPGYTGPNPATADNSALGYGYKPNRIGLRGAGNIAWSWLNANYPTYYPNGQSAAWMQSAVRATCAAGVVWDNAHNGKAVKVTGDTIPLYDYAPIPNAYVELPASTQIANENAMTRAAATVIFYQLRITQGGLLSLSYSLNGGAYQSVIAGQSITASNGALPENFLFGFAGSTGGSTNIHEILCFKADPATSAASSAGASEKQSAKLETGTQAYFAYYNPSGWTGRVTASGLGFDSFGNVIIAATPNWDASCTLTGVAAGKTCRTTGAAGPIPAEAPASRVILSWNGSAGIPFEWGNLTSSPGGGQQAAIDAGDAAPYGANRLNYLRGDRSNEINTSGVGLYRSRTSVLGDIIDSSPTWVGPPVAPYTATWGDRLNPAATVPEAGSSAQTYTQYVAAAQTRMNVVYVGGNDGLLHGFRSGSYDPNGNFVATGNDGLEVLAYMPGAVVQTIHSATANVDYSSAQYGHNFYVDATPGAGDLFYGNAWHSWVVGGLGAGGSAIFALDVTNPTTSTFTEANAASLVIGEWTSASIACANVASCGSSLGNTYGTPQIRRLHDGKWAVIFGNGFGSTSGDAGIFVMTIDPTTHAQTIYYLSTHTAGSGNGIAFASPVDLDGDHITDYVYAGDLQGNLWRFDLTSSSETNWALTPGPLFKTPAGQPITTGIVAASGAPSSGMQQYLMLLFGTGQKTPFTNTNPASYATGTQALYGVWDWNLSVSDGGILGPGAANPAGWNGLSGAQYAGLTHANTGLASPYTLTLANLQAQTATINTTTQNRDIANNATICWAALSTCASNKQFGWYINLPGAQEQIIYGPELVSQALTVNSIVPATTNPTSCGNQSDTGFTYVLSAMTGGAFNQVFLPPSEAANSAINTNPRYTDTNAIAILTNATGSSFITSNAAGTRFLVYETNQVESGMGANGSNILGGTLGLNLPPNTAGRRLTWIELR
ncbi:MAG: pilus assembly protein PilY [Gammaproteobacteria bacterium]|nr:MAG: pilus assembly protein PilY [Gammaproteobacteria bacterium]TLY88529.1 MAG: pilus assembly protein PilY [Gammaproteobacteria bacterium]